MQAKTKRSLGIGLLVIGVGWMILVAFVLRDRFSLREADAFQTMTLAPRGGEALPTLWAVPPFAAVDQDGRSTTPESLSGHVWVADFIFTHCTTACPLISAKLLLVRRRIQSPAVRFVSFSVDPDNDTPPVLAQYAQRWSPDPRWILLNTKGVQDVAKGMRVPLERSRDPLNPILHTTLFFLVDGAGRVRGIYDSLDDDAVSRLVQDAERLDGAPRARVEPPAPQMTGAPADRGHAIYEAVGCAGCHGDVRVAPLLAGVFGRVVRLDDGGTTMADEGYLRASIVDPGAQIVAGYATVMPSYQAHLSEEQVSDLVAYLQSIPAPAGERADPASDVAAAPAVDPVCGMKVAVTGETPRTSFKGKTYYFCSDTCRERFAKAPEKFLDGP